MSCVLGCMMLTGLLSAGGAQALPSYPVPLHMPEPSYPTSMLRSFVKRSVSIRVSFRPMEACASSKCWARPILGSSA